MKYKFIALAMVLALLLSAAAAASMDGGLLPRTIQHEEAQDDNGVQRAGKLPVVCIETDGGILPAVSGKTSATAETAESAVKVGAEVYVYNGDGTGGYDASAPLLRHRAVVRYRGHSSLRFDKKQYKINFVGEDGTEDKSVAFLGMEPYDEWALNAPYMDRSLMHNYLCFNVAGQILPYTPDVRYCEVYVNGSYEGLYLGMETIAKGSGRVDIETYKDGDRNIAYLVREDWKATSESALSDLAARGMLYNFKSNMEVIYPGTDKLNGDNKNRIERDMSRFEKALYSYDYDSFAYGYRQYLDVDTFVDYYLINEFTQNVDAGRYSTYFYKDVKGKLCAGPVWDFNSALGYYVDADLSTGGFVMPTKTFFDMLMKDEAFVNRVIARYRQLRKTVLSEVYLLSFVDDTEVYLGDAITRNNDRWGSEMYGSGTQKEILLQPLDRNPENYPQAVDQLKTFLIRRGKYLDNYIDSLQQYCHESAVKKYNP